MRSRKDEKIDLSDFSVSRTITFSDRDLWEKLTMGDTQQGIIFVWTRINGEQTFKWIDKGIPVTLKCP